VARGAKHDSKGAKHDTGRVQPIADHQVTRSGYLDHSDSFESGPLAPQLGAAANGFEADEDDDYYDVESVPKELDEELGLDAFELNAAAAILQRGTHRNAVRNKINKDRITAVHVAMAKAKKCLDEEPRSSPPQ